MRYPSDRHRKAPEGATVPKYETVADIIAERDALREALAFSNQTMDLLLKTAQAFEKQASQGSGGRRGGPVFTKARKAMTVADAALNTTDGDTR